MAVKVYPLVFPLARQWRRYLGQPFRFYLKTTQCLYNHTYQVLEDNMKSVDRQALSFAGAVLLMAQFVYADTVTGKNIIDSCTAINHEYALARDTSDVNSYISLFTEDAEFIITGKSFKGVEEMKQRIFDDRGKTFGRLLLTTIDITPVDETTATGITYFIMFLTTSSRAESMPIESYNLFMGEYHDTYRMTNEGCKFTRRETRPLFMNKGYEN